jgi:hypothetical protein
MYELKIIGSVFTSKSVGTGPSSYEKRIYRATRERTSKCTNTLYDYAIIINTYVSLTYELKKWKCIYE